MKDEKMSLFLQQNDINSVKDYERFRNLKAYLEQKAETLTFFKDQKEEIWNLAEKVGYNDFNKFLRHREEWHDLKRRIPMAYLKEIEVDWNIIDFVVDLDQNEFRQVLEIPRSPSSASVRLMPALKKTLKLPKDVSENDAIEFVKRYAINEGKVCLIRYEDLLNIQVKPDGRVHKIYLRPEVEINNDFLVARVEEVMQEI